MQARIQSMKDLVNSDAAPLRSRTGRFGGLQVHDRLGRRHIVRPDAAHPAENMDFAVHINPQAGTGLRVIIGLAGEDSPSGLNVK